VEDQLLGTRGRGAVALPPETRKVLGALLEGLDVLVGGGADPRRAFAMKPLESARGSAGGGSGGKAERREADRQAGKEGGVRIKDPRDGDPAPPQKVCMCVRARACVCGGGGGGSALTL
jgi:hypothetical protein